MLQSRYEILEAVEEEASWARYRGLDMRLGREVSIRTFPLPAPREDVEFKAMDARTSQVAALRQPGIENFLDMGFHHRLAFVVSDWAPGGHLGDLIKQGPVSWPEAERLLAGILEALARLHAAGLAHGRLCPSAVLVGAGMAVRLRDLSMGPSDRLAAGSPYGLADRAQPSREADRQACRVLLGDLLGGQLPPQAEGLLTRLLNPGPTPPEPGPDLPGLAKGLGRGWKILAFAALPAALMASLAWFGLGGRPVPPRLQSPEWSGGEEETLYRQARFSLGKRTREDLRKAEAGFRDCLRRRPDDHRAAAGLAVAITLEGVHGALPPAEVEAQARQAAQSALALDHDDAEATAVLAYLAFRFDWDWARADLLFRQAVAKGPRMPLVRHWRGFYLSTAGRHAEALAELKEAVRLDPVDLQILTNLGVAEIWAGQGEEGMATLRRVLDLDPGFVSARLRVLATLETQGRIPEALEEFRFLARVGYLPGAELAVLERGFQSGGAKGYFRARLGQEGGEHPIDAGAIHALSGEKDAAFGRLEEGIRRRHPFVVWVPADPAFRALRSDPRFAAFLERIHYPGR